MATEVELGQLRQELVVIRTACHAVVEESWTVRVSPELAARAIHSNQEALSLLQSDYVLTVENTDTYGEHDRQVLSVVCWEGAVPCQAELSQGTA